VDLRHHPLGEHRRGREVRQLLELGDDRPLGVELGAAVRAAADVRPERGHAKAHLPIEEEIEFVRK
jgi:hypothetical protein